MHSFKSKKSPSDIDLEISSELIPELKDDTRKSHQHTGFASRAEKGQIGKNTRESKKSQNKEKK